MLHKTSYTINDFPYIMIDLSLLLLRACWMVEFFRMIALQGEQIIYNLLHYGYKMI